MYLNALVCKLSGSMHSKILLLAVCLTFSVNALTINHHRIPPRHSILVKLNDLEADDSPLIQPQDDLQIQIQDDDYDYYHDDMDTWTTSPDNDTVTSQDDDWFDDSYLASKNSTITQPFNSSSILDSLLDILSTLVTDTNQTASFTFITHIQLKPRSCPDSVAAEFDNAIRSINPGVIVNSKPISAGAVPCKDGSCPCSDSLASSLLWRKLSITTLQMSTTTSSEVQLPNNFPFSYKVVSTQ